MSLKRKFDFEQSDSCSSVTSLCAEDPTLTKSSSSSSEGDGGGGGRGPTVKHIKTEQLLDRTSSNNILHSNNSTSNDHHERKCFNISSPSFFVCLSNLF